METVRGTTSLVGLLGWPVSHSLSPNMHNAAFKQLGLDWAYVPFPVRPTDLPKALKGLMALNVKGVNVTVPHKQAVMRYMDEVSKAAQTIGAVNTIYLKEGKFVGYNTDSTGFLNSLIEAECHPKGLRVAVLGAGGAARAVVFALTWAEVDSVVVLNRTAERAAFLIDDLIDTFPGSTLHFAPLTESSVVALKDSFDLVINTTSVGMYPHVDDCLWPKNIPMPSTAAYCDLVYNPLETVFLARAKMAGAKTIDGLGMLIHQGAAALELWTGKTAPADVMRQACLAGLLNRPVRQ
ncbi:shikimate dehydrogenase [Anaerolineales bacterium HSG6]|nr:shikimate dehydrogenase [Anaerolineales bacterium HSG6]MDM8531202.1 shikimate dehydrogenase [Anaerolineales bacterium HSG25]